MFTARQKASVTSSEAVNSLAYPARDNPAACTLLRETEMALASLDLLPGELVLIILRELPISSLTSLAHLSKALGTRVAQRASEEEMFVPQGELIARAESLDTFLSLLLRSRVLNHVEFPTDRLTDMSYQERLTKLARDDCVENFFRSKQLQFWRTAAGLNESGLHSLCEEAFYVTEPDFDTMEEPSEAEIIQNVQQSLLRHFSTQTMHLLRALALAAPDTVTIAAKRVPLRMRHWPPIDIDLIHMGGDDHFRLDSNESWYRELGQAVGLNPSWTAPQALELWLSNVCDGDWNVVTPARVAVLRHLFGQPWAVPICGEVLMLAREAMVQMEPNLDPALLAQSMV
jgi:hypothetical protein